MTKREVLIARAAYRDGHLNTMMTDFSLAQSPECRYPLPKVTRQRVVTWKGGPKFKVDPTTRELWCQPTDVHTWWADTWNRYAHRLSREPDFVLFLADLIEHPTEEVEE